MSGMHKRPLAILVLVLLGTSAGLFLAHAGVADHDESCSVCLLAQSAYAELTPTCVLVLPTAAVDAPSAPALLSARAGTPREAAPRAPPAS